MITLQQAFARAFALEAAGRFGEARAIYDQILAAIPDHPGALLKIAARDAKDGKLDAAVAQLDRALASATAQGLPSEDILLVQGRVHIERGDRGLARAAFERAQAQGSTAPDVYRFLAWFALEDDDAARAAALCRAGLLRYPRDAQLLHVLGKALKAQGVTEEARVVLVDAVAASGGDPAMLVSLGAASIDAGRPAEARGYLERAIAGGQGSAEAWDNLGLALRHLQEYDEAANAFTRAVDIDPRLASARSNLVNALRYVCRWDAAEAAERQWLASIAAGDGDAGGNPAVSLCVGTTPAQQLQIARIWANGVLPPVAPAVIRERGTRLRVGYLSADLHAHATAFLMAGMFEQHDRARIAATAYSYGPDDGSAMRRRVQAAFEHWVEVGTMTDLECAQRIRADGIDVLVDLKGYTGNARLGMLSRRPAPVQLHYLGYPGTLGFDGIDGMVADAIVVPRGTEADYHERVWRVPRCYQVNDSRRALPPAASRAALGLPDDAIVLACFNQTYKVTRGFFEAWTSVLAEVDTAILWLYAPIPSAQRNLAAEATRAGIDPSRIRFAPAVGQNEHIARLRAADLALDVLPYGSHTTGSDALWAGTPMLSCRGTTFAGRVGASLLDGVGLPELVAASLDAYRDALLGLARDRDRLRGYRDHLERERHRLPLFDTAGFTRDFERVLFAASDAAGSRAAGG